MKKIFEKLKQIKGETLTETLVALLISVLAFTLLASMIVSGNMLTAKSEKEMSAYYSENNSLSSSADGEAAVGTGSVVIKRGSTDFCLVPGKSSYAITYYVNDVFENTPVVSYELAY